MNIVRLTESLKVQSLPALGVSLTIRGGEAWTRAKLATKGMAHFIFGRGGKGISLLSKRSGGKGGRGGERGGEGGKKILYQMWFGRIYMFGGE